jgi:hypothetical protein
LSAIDARKPGFKVTVLADACAAVDEEMELVALEYTERVVYAFVSRAAIRRLRRHRLAAACSRV